MNNSNIDVDIIDETLLYICIDGKREHISVDNARIKYAKNKQVLDLIDLTLNRYYENSRPLEPRTPEESPLPNVEEPDIDNVEIDLSELNGEPLAPAPKKDLDSNPLEDVSEPSIRDLRSEPLAPPSKKDLDTKPLEDDKSSLKDLRSAPLGLVNESKFASIYEKYSGRIRETFPTDSPSFLDVEKLTKDKKALEEI